MVGGAPASRSKADTGNNEEDTKVLQVRLLAMHYLASLQRVAQLSGLSLCAPSSAAVAIPAIAPLESLGSY